MTNEAAFVILEEALRKCEKENRKTDEVYAALKHLAPQARRLYGERSSQWPFHQFWNSLDVEPDELDYQATGRFQMVNAALNGIRLRVPTK